jgi:hypothetical protein
VALADVERRRLAAEAGPAPGDVDRVAGLREAHPGGEAGHAGSQDREPHRSAGSSTERLELGIVSTFVAAARCTSRCHNSNHIRST